MDEFENNDIDFNIISDEVIAIREKRICIDDCLKVKEAARNRIKNMRTLESKESMLKLLFGDILPLLSDVEVKTAESEKVFQTKSKKLPPISPASSPGSKHENSKALKYKGTYEIKTKLYANEKVPSQKPTSADSLTSKPPQIPTHELAKRQAAWLAKLELNKNKNASDIDHLKYFENLPVPEIAKPKTNWKQAKEESIRMLEKEEEFHALKLKSQEKLEQLKALKIEKKIMELSQYDSSILTRLKRATPLPSSSAVISGTSNSKHNNSNTDKQVEKERASDVANTEEKDINCVRPHLRFEDEGGDLEEEGRDSFHHAYAGDTCRSLSVALQTTNPAKSIVAPVESKTGNDNYISPAQPHVASRTLKTLSFATSLSFGNDDSKANVVNTSSDSRDSRDSRDGNPMDLVIAEKLSSPEERVDNRYHAVDLKNHKKTSKYSVDLLDADGHVLVSSYANVITETQQQHFENMNYAMKNNSHFQVISKLKENSAKGIGAVSAVNDSSPSILTFLASKEKTFGNNLNMDDSTIQSTKQLPLIAKKPTRTHLPRKYRKKASEDGVPTLELISENEFEDINSFMLREDADNENIYICSEL